MHVLLVFVLDSSHVKWNEILCVVPVKITFMSFYRITLVQHPQFITLFRTKDTMHAVLF